MEKKCLPHLRDVIFLPGCFLACGEDHSKNREREIRLKTGRVSTSGPGCPEVFLFRGDWGAAESAENGCWTPRVWHVFSSENRYHTLILPENMTMIEMNVYWQFDARSV
ncbi:MAG: hypothetical protein ACI4OJ_08640 [Lachnospiraceae bacterium]